jgi:predicted ATPase with chaperone activity
MVDDRLIELRASLRAGDRAGLRIEGLPRDRTRTTADRVRAALVNDGLVQEAPGVTVRVEPAVIAGSGGHLDLPIALSVLLAAGVVGDDLRWVLATGRLGLDGSVIAAGVVGRLTLSDAVGSLCQTPVLGFEQVFEGEGG